MGEERLPGFSKLRGTHCTHHSRKESKKPWPKQQDRAEPEQTLLSRVAGDKGGMTTLQWVPESPSEHGEVASQEGQCSPSKQPGCWLSEWLRWLRHSSLGRATFVPSLLFSGSLSLEQWGSWQHCLTHFAVPCVIIWGIRTSGQELMGAVLCRVEVFVRNMHHVCKGRSHQAEGRKVFSV